MATEPQRSEIMSGAPSSSEFASHTPGQTDFSADAALILAALGRMEAVVRDERAAFDRLRVMLGDMAQAVARAKTVADSETAATVLNELEHRVDAMVDIAGHSPVTAAAAIPDPQLPSSAARIERDAALLAHGVSAVQHADATPAPAADVVEQAIQHPADPDLVPTVSDVVSRLGSDEMAPPGADAGVSTPTVAMLTAMVEALRDSISTAAPEPEATLEGSASRAAEVLVPPLDAAPPPEIAEVAIPAVEFAEAESAHLIEAPQAGEAPVEAPHAIEGAEAADIAPSADAAPDNSPFLAMLNARLEALKAAEAAAALVPEALIEAPQPPANVAEVVAQPLEVAPPPETASIEIAEVATPAMEIVQAAEAAQVMEAPQAEAPQTVEATPAIEATETTQSPADAAPDPGSIVALLSARLAALRAAAAAAALEPKAPIEATPPAPQVAEVAAQPAELAPQDLAPQDLAPPPGTSSSEIAEVATPAMEAYQASAAIHPAEDAASVPRPSFAGVHESALLASLEQMGARPFPPPDEGTAVIFTPKQESEFLPEFTHQLVAPPEMARSETAPEPEQPAAPQFATEPAAVEQAGLEPTAAEPASAETTMAEILSDLTQALAPGPAQPATVEVAAPDVEPTMPIEPTAEPAAAVPPPDAAAAAETAESDFDPADFLFEPEPEPDPAAFLLEPAPPPAARVKAVVLPQPEFVAPPAKPAAEKPAAVQPVEPDQPAQATPEPAPRDPLHALKAMSENEKIALFS